MEKLKKILDSETNKWIVKKAKPQVFGIRDFSALSAVRGVPKLSSAGLK